MKRYISIKDKLILNFIIIGVTIIVVISLFSYYTARDVLINRTFEQLTTVRVIKERQLNNFFNDRKNDVELIAESKEIHEVINQIIINTRNNKSNNLQAINNEMILSNLEYLLQYLGSKPFYRSLYIITREGYGIQASIGNKSLKTIGIPYMQRDSTISSLISQISDNDSIHLTDLDNYYEKSSLFIGSNIPGNQSTVIGCVIMEISSDALNNIMLETNPASGLGQSGESYLVGNDLLMRSNSRFHDHAILNTRVTTESVNKALNGTTGTAITKDYRGVKVLSSYAPLRIEQMKWVLLAEMDIEEALTPLSAITNNIIIVSTFIALLLFIYAYIMSNSITFPIIRLKDAANKIGKGNFDLHLKSSSKDEIGDLTKSFNNMTIQLKDSEKKLQEERSRRLRSVFDGQEIERQRLSRELHDGLGQDLIGLKLKLESIHGNDIRNINRSIKGVKNALDQTIDEIRRISNDLMPAVLNEFGLVTAIQKVAEDISENSNIKVQLKQKGNIESIGRTIKTYLFRILQEALNNTIRHSKATKVLISIEVENNFLTLDYRDNGIGFDPEDDLFLKGHGMTNMKERVELLKGNMHLHSVQDNGTTIKIKIPI